MTKQIMFVNYPWLWLSEIITLSLSSQAYFIPKYHTYHSRCELARCAMYLTIDGGRHCLWFNILEVRDSIIKVALHETYTPLFKRTFSTKTIWKPLHTIYFQKSEYLNFIMVSSFYLKHEAGAVLGLKTAILVLCHKN